MLRCLQRAHSTALHGRIHLRQCRWIGVHTERSSQSKPEKHVSDELPIAEKYSPVRTSNMSQPSIVS